MMPSEPLTRMEEIEHQLERAHAQLLRYAHDLKHLLDAERRKTLELAEAHAKLLLLDQLKTDFLTFIAHELRTPLTYMNVVVLFDLQGNPQEQAQLLDLMRSGYERLQGVIQKGLEYFAWRATERVETQATVDLAEVFRQAADDLPSLVAPGVAVQVATPGVACRIRGEDRYVATVIRILFDNAVKFSRQEPSIAVQLQATSTEVTLMMTDRGQGFPPELAHELFQPFTIADVMHHREGTGLNLALARAIVEAYDGQIRAESAGLGTGATFTVTFPALPPPEAAGF